MIYSNMFIIAVRLFGFCSCQQCSHGVQYCRQHWQCQIFLVVSSLSCWIITQLFTYFLWSLDTHRYACPLHNLAFFQYLTTAKKSWHNLRLEKKSQKWPQMHGNSKNCNFNVISSVVWFSLFQKKEPVGKCRVYWPFDQWFSESQRASFDS